MRYFVFIFLLIVACGGGSDGKDGGNGDSCTVQESENGAVIVCDDGSTVTLEDGKNGSDGQNGTNGADYTPVVADFQGHHVFPNGGYLELVQTSDDRLLIYGTQRLYSVNFDGGLAYHPVIPAGPHYIRDGRVVGEYNTNYDGTINDLERDGSTSNITGVRKTVYMIEKIGDNIQVTLTVFGPSGLTVDATRVITSER